jgi:hypothetical protein
MNPEEKVPDALDDERYIAITVHLSIKAPSRKEARKLVRQVLRMAWLRDGCTGQKLRPSMHFHEKWRGWINLAIGDIKYWLRGHTWEARVKDVCQLETDLRATANRDYRNTVHVKAFYYSGVAADGEHLPLRGWEKRQAEGEQASHAGKPPDVNPYPLDTQEHEAWQEGYYFVQWERITDAGADAFYAGKPTTANPYREDDPGYEPWLFGWVMAQEMPDAFDDADEEETKE